VKWFLLLLLAACATVEPPRGNPARGREVFTSREGGHCVLCHAVPGVTLAGNIGPDLAGIGARLNPAELRQRVSDMSRVSPATAMPSFHRTEDLARVDPQYAGKPVLSDAQLDDVVAYLSSLR
jgi:sulfur-oxidizing protein SoxX